MKKILSIIAVILAVLTVYFCFFDSTENKPVDSLQQQIESNISFYPLYNRLADQERQAYIKLYEAIKNFNPSVNGIYEGKSKRELENYIETLRSVYLEIHYEYPEFFWYDPYSCKFSIRNLGGDRYVLDMSLSYLFDKDTVQTLKQDFEQKLEEIVSIAKTKTSTYDQVLYVHDYIVDNCVYDYDAYNNEDYSSPSINAYGCLINGKAICSGYSLAFSAVMKRLGYEIGVEFASYDSFSIFGENHVWNYCKLDGDYYYFDLTWDDIDPSNSRYSTIPYYHSYFAITKDELAKAHLALAPQAPTPDCNGTKYNYFIYNNINFSEYNFETIKPVILQQSDKSAIELRFDSYSELLAAERNLLTEKKIFQIFPEAQSYQYYISKSNLQLYIFINN